MFRDPCLLVCWTRALLACPLTVLVGPRFLSVCSLVDRTLACCLRLVGHCSFVDSHWPRPSPHEIFLLVRIVQCWAPGPAEHLYSEIFLVQTLVFCVDDVANVAVPACAAALTLAALIRRRASLCCCAYGRGPRPPAGRRSVDLGR